MLNKYDVEPERSKQLRHGDKSQSHGNDSEIRGREQAHQDNRADQAKDAVEELEQHHPAGASHHLALNAG